MAQVFKIEVEFMVDESIHKNKYVATIKELGCVVVGSGIPDCLIELAKSINVMECYLLKTQEIIKNK